MQKYAKIRVIRALKGGKMQENLSSIKIFFNL
jgi:hypothetical protein